ncbi:hypothetical protein NDU88_008704 [Pleurodeles waltl]|uniref:Uncharacterized protein n=1 Tax=Pleurodeles waltl TaxID=8319 RepID=A0AAV7QVC9_PLEWA|nr:hypothetical protein NDU88_008704 [Pleurodeles waltl]
MVRGARLSEMKPGLRNRTRAWPSPIATGEAVRSAWLETYRMGPNKAQNEEPGPSQHWGKMRRTRGLMGNTQVTKPTQQQTSQGKKAALQTAASL